MGQVKIIRGGRVVTKDRIIEGGSVIMEDGVITEIRQRELYVRGVEIHDAEGMWVLPGLIDTHSDAIEQEMQPRPGTLFPLERSFYELEKKLAAQGITTIYHSLCMMGDEGENQVRRNEAVLHSVDTIRRLRIQKSRLHHKIHVRFEITNLNAARSLRT